MAAGTHLRLVSDDAKTVTFRPDGSGYGTVDCSWEDKRRKDPIAEWAAQGFADGWKAQLIVEAAW